MSAPRHLASDDRSLVNPLHPKLKGGAAGLLGGSVIGGLIDMILSRFGWYTDGDSLARTALLFLIVAACGQVGHYIGAYWAKWEPEVDTVVTRVTHAVLPDRIADQIDAKFVVWSDSIVERLAGLLQSVQGAGQLPVETVSTGVVTQDEVTTSGAEVSPPVPDVEGDSPDDSHLTG